MPSRVAGPTAVEAAPQPPASTAGATDAQTLVVPQALAGLRLDQALARMLPEHSRSRLKGWIDAGHVTIAGTAWDGKRRVAGGEDVAIAQRPEATTGAALAQDIAFDIAYEDESIIVLDKPAGLVVHPGSGNRDGTLQNALLHHDPALAAIPRAGIVHRLDKDTSGLMVVARTESAHTSLVRQLAARTMSREYLALARGDVAQAMTIDAPIGRHPIRRTSMAVVAKGKPARTHLAVIERFGIATLLRCRLETGRTHQIRVHLAAIGHPLVGDPAYGGRRSEAGVPAFARQALHATRLALDHPATGRSMRFDAPAPADLAALIERLRTSRGAAAR
ncbi:MAG: 23S rRNA pseudouridine(1911/1915/1917) synthase RluD [Betaproteobacteria bacterium]|nr:23S rRNA pseudouridine(1911/1915/1917) synthase RluD [Betaproteobacteria bacterium]